MKEEDKRLFEMILDDPDEEGLYALSLVDQPAMKAHWLALSSHKETKNVMFKTVDADQHILLGAVLIPDVPVYRNWDDGLYIYFSEDTIRKSHELAMKKGLSTFTIQHGKPAPNIYLLETWMVEDPKMDKQAVYGMENPKGTWMVSLKVNNVDVWEDFIKSGDLVGFSIEGLFKMKDTPDGELSDDEFLDAVKEAIKS